MQTLLSQATHKFKTRHIPEPYLDAEVLLSFVLGKDRTWLLAHNTDTVPARAHKRFAALVKRRMTFEPIAYLTGEQEFYGRMFSVTKSVLIPRPKTELLIEEALAHIPIDKKILIADVGTGSGNIAVTLACERPRIRIIATDTSTRAINIAQKNAKRHGVNGRIHFLHGSLLAPLRTTKPDILLTNLPYVPASRKLCTAAERATAHEPTLALSGSRKNKNGRAVLLHFLGQLHTWKNKPHVVLMEVGSDQYAAIQKAAQVLAPEFSWSLHAPLGGKAHVLIGKE